MLSSNLRPRTEVDTSDVGELTSTNCLASHVWADLHGLFSMHELISA